MSEPDAPRSRGLWWKVPLAAFALLLLIAFVAHAIWTAGERAAVAQRVAAIRALGEPIDVSDLVEPTVPDAENAAVAIRAAAAVLASSEGNSNDLQKGAIERDDPQTFLYPPTTQAMAALEAAIDDNAAGLRAIDSIAPRAKVAWRDATTSGVPRRFRSQSELNDCRGVGLLLQDAARLAAAHDATADVVRRLRQMDVIAGVVSERRTLVSTYVASGIGWQSGSTAIELAPRLAIDLRSRDAVLARAAELLDDRPIYAIWRNGVLAERLELHELMSFQTTHPGDLFEVSPTTLGKRLFGKTIAPLVLASDAAVLDVMAELVPLIDRPNLLAFRGGSAG